jgi:hypothetical protein
MPETTKSEVVQGETVICLYPGCERPAIEKKMKDNAPSRQGPPPRYCDDDDHNAATAFREMKRLEEEAAGA